MMEVFITLTISKTRGILVIMKGVLRKREKRGIAMGVFPLFCTYVGFRESHFLILIELFETTLKQAKFDIHLLLIISAN